MFVLLQLVVLSPGARAASKAVPALPLHKTARYELNERNKFIMQAKQQICNILRFVLDFDLDMRLSRFVRAFLADEFSKTSSFSAMRMINTIATGAATVVGATLALPGCVNRA